MKQTLNITDGMFQSRPLREDEYLNEIDGLIYCSRCRTPRQHRVQFKERVIHARLDGQHSNGLCTL